jgi:(p)ppGpp synthase/HD superfamily hydrolase
MDPLRHVKFFAAVKHTGQIYSGGMPYTHHLAAVESVLRRFGVTDENMLSAAWLHDVLEDTETSSKEIEEMFGAEIVRLVKAVTNEDGPNRKTRNALTYPKIREAGENAVKLKLADRIANIETGGSLVQMYKKEYEDFKRALYTVNQAEEMWNHLDLLLN